MRLNCPECHKEIQLNITNVLRQRIEDRLELLKERKKIEGKDSVPMSTDDIIKIFESILKPKTEIIESQNVTN